MAFLVFIGARMELVNKKLVVFVGVLLLISRQCLN